MLIAGVAGGSGTGKSSVLNALKNMFPEGYITIISMDWYYKETTHLSMPERSKINFDHPDAFEIPLLIDHLTSLKQQKPVCCPEYSYIEMNRLKQTRLVTPSPIVILEGLYPLLDESLREYLNPTIYLESTKATRLKRITERDFRSRNRTPDEVAVRFRNIVNPMHLEFVKKQKYLADYIVTNEEKKESCAKKIKNILTKHLKNDKTDNP
ncbi:MAG: uridine kinase [Bacteroidota bacterium]